MVQLKEGLLRRYAVKLVKASRLVICKMPVVSRSGTEVPPGEQMEGRMMLAMLAPWKMTSTPSGNSMRASKGPLQNEKDQQEAWQGRNKIWPYALRSEPLSATVKPLSVTLVTVPPVKASVASSTMCETTAKGVRVSAEVNSLESNDSLVLPIMPVR